MALIRTNVSYWNWYGFPGVYAASYILIEILGFVFVGVIAGLIFRGAVDQSETVGGQAG